MGIVEKIKNDAKKSGQNKGKFMYFREGQKTRIRFLTDMEQGLDVEFHDSYALGINVPCQTVMNRDCPYCEEEGLRTRSQYIWSVYDYEAKEVKLFMFAVNNCSPVPQMIALFENYGTITDRDFVITVQGKQQNKTYSVIPLDKVKFRNDKVKPYSKQAVLKMVDSAYPADGAEQGDDEEEERPSRSKAAASASKSKQKNPKVDDDEEEDWDDGEDEVEDYSSMTPVELYKMCKERGISVVPKKPEKYYIKLLEDDDEASDDWGDEE